MDFRFSAIKLQVQNFISSMKYTIFYLGTALLFIAAARNSLTWHLQNIWGLSHNFWQNLWVYYLELFGHNYFLLYMTCGFVIPTILFWMFSSFLLYVDITGKPAWALAYKIQDNKDVPVDLKKVKKLVFVVLRNEVMGFLIGICFYPLFCWRLTTFTYTLPTFQRVLVDIAGCLLIEEILFYYTHRLLHHPKLYKHVHKIHHEWTAPIGLVALYAHPIENIVSNFIPILVGPLLMGAHVSIIGIWLTVVSLNTTNSHSGYHFPCFPSPEQHDFHHLKFNQCYGVLGILDNLHNTNDVFRASKHYQRHIMHFSLTPVKEEFPDDDKHMEKACSSKSD